MGEKRPLRGGYTTGACAAAGVKAALLFLRGEMPAEVEVRALDGTPLLIPVKCVRATEEGAEAEIVKFSGDDPDITNGVSVFTRVRELPIGSGLRFCAGKGIGTVTKQGLSVPVGAPAINPGPQELIRRTAQAVLDTEALPDLEVTISIPAGVKLARQTLNPVLGVEGGISVIGTTGVLRPMSEEGFKNSLVPQIDVAMAAGVSVLVFVPGKIGENLARACGLPQAALVQTSNFIGFMLDRAAERQVKRVLLFGHIGKLVKVAAGNFYTHNRIADARLETMAAYAAAAGMASDGVRQILAANTTEDALAVIDAAGLQAVYDILAARASCRSERHVFGKLRVGTVLLTLSGRVLGMDETAREIGGGYHWSIASLSQA